MHAPLVVQSVPHINTHKRILARSRPPIHYKTASCAPAQQRRGRPCPPTGRNPLQWMNGPAPVRLLSPKRPALPDLLHYFSHSDASDFSGLLPMCSDIAVVAVYFTTTGPNRKWWLIFLLSQICFTFLCSFFVQLSHKFVEWQKELPKFMVKIFDII